MNAPRTLFQLAPPVVVTVVGAVIELPANCRVVTVVPESR